MGLVLPSIIDEALDLIGVNWPNIDEDDYFEMATSMRDFAEQFEGRGGDADKAVTRILNSSEGWAVESMQKHWTYVKTGHLDKIPEVARLFATACDGVGEIIRGLKVKAGVELGVLAGTIVAELAAAPLTLGLSAAAAAGEIALMRTVVKRIVDEAVDQIVDALITKVTEPVTGKLAELVSDMTLDLAEGAFNPGDKPGGMKLASAGDSDSEGGGSGGAGKATVIDHIEFEDGAGKVSRHGSDMGSQSGIHLSKSKVSFGRTKGKEPLTQAFDGILEGAIDGMEKAAKKAVDHVTDTIPERVKAASRHQKRKDHDVRDEVEKVDTKRRKTDSDTRMYLLNEDGTVDRLMPDGTIPTKGAGGLDKQDRTHLASILEPDGTVWRPQTSKDLRKWRVKGKDRGKATSTKVDPATSDLAQATQLARKGHDYYKGGNYAAGRYIDPESGKTSILIGRSGDKHHSERNIGHPLLHNNAQGGLKDLFTEREPCQLNPRCNRWLQHFFGHDNPDLKVTHVADYDQSDQKTKNKEHDAYVNQLKKAHGK